MPSPADGSIPWDGWSRETVRGAVYLAARYGVGVILGLGNMLVMTWWIGPHAYGLFVTAVGIVAFLATLTRGGIDTYLVRSETEPDNRSYGTAATLILAASAVLVLAAVLVIPLLLRWFGNGEFVAPYLWLLTTIPVTGLTGIAMAKLERRLDFRNIAGIELIGQSAGLLVSAFVAWSRASVWAPVAGQIVGQCFTLLGAMMCASLHPSLAFHRGQARAMLSYGLALTASLRTWQLRNLVNPLLVGRFAGAEGVAFVALAIRIAEALGTFRLAAGRMGIAALSRIQNSRDHFRKTLESALRLQVLALGPLLCGFALAGPFLLPLMAGARWQPSLAVYPFVAAGVLINSVYNLQASALFVIGRPWIVLQGYAAHVALLTATTLLLSPRFGIAGYGWAELAACGGYGWIHFATARTTPISYRKLAPWLVGFLLCLLLASVAPTLSHFIRHSIVAQ